MTPLKKLFLAFLIASTSAQTVLPNTQENIENTVKYLSYLLVGVNLFPKTIIDPNTRTQSIISAAIYLPIIGYLAAYFTTMCHEGGHALACKLTTGNWPKVIQIGKNTVFTLAGGKINLGTNLFSAEIEVPDIQYAHQFALITLAGPIAGTLGALLLQKIKRFAQAYFEKKGAPSLQNNPSPDQSAATPPSAPAPQKSNSFLSNYVTSPLSKMWNITTWVPKKLWSTFGPLGIVNLAQLDPLIPGSDGFIALMNISQILAGRYHIEWDNTKGTLDFF